MDTKPKTPKMIRIKLPQQRIKNLNAYNILNSTKTAPVQNSQSVVANDDMKVRKAIIKRDDLDNTDCYFEVVDHSLGKENSDTHSAIERVYINPNSGLIKDEMSTTQIKIKDEAKKNKSFEVHNVRVYTDKYKTGTSSTGEIKKECEVDNECETTKEYQIENEYGVKEECVEQNEYIESTNNIIKQVPSSDQDFEETMDTFFITNNKPDKVKVIKNEDENKENSMTLNNTQNDTAESYQTDNISQESTLISDQNLIQIFTENGTLLLENNEMVQELIKNGQLIINDEEPEETQEVVLSEGDTLEETDFVLEYVDETNQGNVDTISCDCGEEFQDLREFEIHQNEHKDHNTVTVLKQQPFETYLCYCGEKFEDIDEFEKHHNKHRINVNILKTESYNEKHKCDVCNKIYITANLLQNHMASHVQDDAKVKKRRIQKREQKMQDNLLCEICSKPFKYRSTLRIHMKAHTEGKRHECEICHKRFTQHIGLRKHRFTHINPITCSHCDLIFRDKDTFELHKLDGVCPMQTAKELIQRWKLEVVTSKCMLVYVCSICDTMHTTDDKLEEHIMTTHILDSTKLFCFECGEEAPSKEELKAHILSHTMTYTKKLPCKECGAVCESRASLAIHQRVHTNERPYECQVCSRTFKTKIHMQSHQLVHTKEKNFACPVCSKSFALKGNMMAHLRGHTGEKPYVCPLCKEAFKDTKILKKHKMMCHPDSDMPWEPYLRVSKTRASSLALMKESSPVSPSPS